MKRFLLLTVLVSVLVSCSAKKQIEQAISRGNYDVAINDALKRLENNKDKKRKQEYVKMLKDAYGKVLTEDLATIKQLKKDGNPELFDDIYESYIDLEARQNAIKRILPLQINGKQVTFKFNDYSDAIVDYRYKTSEYIIDKGIDILDTPGKQNARKAHGLFEYVESINPNFDEVRDLLNEAHYKGIDYVYVSIKNDTEQIIPERLEEELLDFNTYGLNQFWTTFHAVVDDSLNYDFEMQLQLKQINISPERINERQLLRERDIVDGWEYQLDTNGNVAKDSLGNDIKIDKIINVSARFVEVIQTKSTQVIANVVYTDLSQKQIIDTFTIDSGYVFENIFGRFRGDRRALNRDDIELVRLEQINFPTDEQMVYDTGEDLKLKLKDIISSYRLGD
ncbi:SEC5 family protein [Winogradskyella sp.]|nr:SEC5 family protein [Winogradskyella sp.]MDC0009106.1 SEC5 family protein [Winogradskyella sp.]MDC1506095.1 SEC5 family protein [Winogradskyella sp.]